MEIETVLKVLANLLRDLAARIDAGNSNLTEEEAIELVSVIGHYTNREEYISKYEACKYLNISRATFDNCISALLLLRLRSRKCPILKMVINTEVKSTRWKRLRKYSEDTNQSFHLK